MVCCATHNVAADTHSHTHTHRVVPSNTSHPPAATTPPHPCHPPPPYPQPVAPRKHPLFLHPHSRTPPCHPHPPTPTPKPNASHPPPHPLARASAEKLHKLHENCWVVVVVVVVVYQWGTCWMVDWWTRQQLLVLIPPQHHLYMMKKMVPLEYTKGIALYKKVKPNRATRRHSQQQHPHCTSSPSCRCLLLMQRHWSMMGKHG